MPNIGSETQHTRPRRTVELRPTRRAVLLVVVAALAALICLPVLQRVREPVYQGRRISAWFNDLCTGVFPFHDANRWSRAADAFSRRDSNAVPFLVTQLTYDQGGSIERIELGAQKVPLVSKVAMQLVVARVIGVKESVSTQAY